MTDTQKHLDKTVDFITGKEVPNTGAEGNRQAVERFLVEAKGFSRKDIEVDAEMALTIEGKPYNSQIDLVISVEGKRFMAAKCAAGSLGSREREILAAARLIHDYQLPVSIVSDGITAIVLDTNSGRKTGEGLDAIPSFKKAVVAIEKADLQPLPDKRAEKEKLIFRSYDTMNVNVARNL